MPLLLPSLEIEGFRTFDHLQLPRLGRVNLLVGKNNSGKSSLLEAIRIFVTRGSAVELRDILTTRDEMSQYHAKVTGDVDVEQAMVAYQQLFHGRSEVWKEDRAITIRTNDRRRNELMITMEWLERSNADHVPLSDGRLIEIDDTRRPVLTILSSDTVRHIPADIDQRRLSSRSLRETDVLARHSFIGPHGLTSRETTRLWDEIALTELEEQVVRALRIISPEIDRISAVGERVVERIMVARTSEAKRPLPLRSMGDGMNRLLGIALGLVTAQGGVLLVDEIENGIHFTVQERLWELIFHEAHRLNIQVFATTHSWDCIEAFQRAARREENEAAVLIRLDHRDGSVWPTTFSERELSIVTQEHLEVR